MPERSPQPMTWAGASAVVVFAIGLGSIVATWNSDKGATTERINGLNRDVLTLQVTVAKLTDAVNALTIEIGIERRDRERLQRQQDGK